MEPIYVLITAVLGAVLIAVLVSILSRRPTSAPTDVERSEERLRQLEAEIANSRTEKALLDRRLAIEEQKASRLPELEKVVADRTHAIELLIDAKAVAERQLAVSSEGLARVQTALEEVRERLTSSGLSLETLRRDKSGLDEMLASKIEAVTRLETSIEEIRTRATAAEEAREQTAVRLDAATGEKGELQSEIARTTALLAEKSAAVERLTAKLDATTEALTASQKDASELGSSVAKLREALDQERSQSKEKLQLLTDAREQMTHEFKVLASEVMTSHGETFSKQNREQIDTILGPLRERISEFQRGLQTSYEESVKERATLSEKIRQLSGDSERMTMQTTSLTRALRGESQTQGAWGEMILASILERSGLREGEEYVAQGTHSNQEGQRLRPDVVINLPGGERLVVDSKVSLTAFDAYVNASSEAERDEALARHVSSIHSHIKALKGKEYPSAIGSQLDYVVMFVPIEGALAAALKWEPTLTAFAVENNVAIATPTTLMIALRTVASVWHVERRNRNAESIALRAGRLYDKLVAFIQDMEALGSRLNQAQHCHEQAMSKLSAGRGNLVQQVERLKSLGAKTNKSLPSAMVESEDSEPSSAEEERTLLVAHEI